MTETGGFDSNQNLAAAWRREIEIDDGERARRGVGRRKPDLGEDGGFDAHRRLPKLKTLRMLATAQPDGHAR